MVDVLNEDAVTTKKPGRRPIDGDLSANASSSEVCSNGDGET
jgi:hypothetical protein